MRIFLPELTIIILNTIIKLSAVIFGGDNNDDVFNLGFTEDAD